MRRARLTDKTELQTAAWAGGHQPSGTSSNCLLVSFFNLTLKKVLSEIKILILSFSFSPSLSRCLISCHLLHLPAANSTYKPRRTLSPTVVEKAVRNHGRGATLGLKLKLNYSTVLSRVVCVVLCVCVRAPEDCGFSDWTQCVGSRSSVASYSSSTTSATSSRRRSGRMSQAATPHQPCDGRVHWKGRAHVQSGAVLLLLLLRPEQ